LGVQGRYFVIALPVAAIFMASLINLELPARHARADWDYRLHDCGNHDRGRGAASTLMMCQGADMAAHF
jgi:hypothetical protein